MSFFIKRNNLYLHQYLCINIIYSFLFIITYMNMCDHINITKFFYHLIYAKSSSINNYLLCTFVYIILIILAATSFMGIPLISLSVLYRIGCLVFSIQNLAINLSFYKICITIIPQIILEILITYMLSYMATYLSLQSFKLTFLQKENFRFKYLVNYLLNYLIIVILCLFLSCFIKIYLL